eukprot:2047160-Pleurochrysis_carterae.AAC.3
MEHARLQRRNCVESSAWTCFVTSSFRSCERVQAGRANSSLASSLVSRLDDGRPRLPVDAREAPAAAQSAQTVNQTSSFCGRRGSTRMLAPTTSHFENLSAPGHAHLRTRQYSLCRSLRSVGSPSCSLSRPAQICGERPRQQRQWQEPLRERGRRQAQAPEQKLLQERERSSGTAQRTAQSRHTAEIRARAAFASNKFV